MHAPLPGDGPHIPFSTQARHPDPAVGLLHPGLAALRLYSPGVAQRASGCHRAEGPLWFGDHGGLPWSAAPMSGGPHHKRLFMAASHSL